MEENKKQKTKKKSQKNAVVEVGNYNKDYCKRSGENIYRVAGVG